MAIQVAENLEEASEMLDGWRTLDPKEEEKFRQYYVNRQVESHDRIIHEGKTALRSSRTFHWFFSGHTGAGKSTELNRLLLNEELKKDYIPLYIDINEGDPEKRTVKIEYSEIIFEIAVACVKVAEETDKKFTFSKELVEYIDNWRKNAKIEREVYTGTEGSAGVKLGAWFGWLREEIKSGGQTKKTFTEELYADVNKFIELINKLAAEIEKHFKRKALVILDGLDHLEVAPCKDLFSNYSQTLTRPKVSKLFVVSLYLLNTDFRAVIQGSVSTLPNIKVFRDHESDELDDNGYGFYKDLISRYAPLDFFTEEALKSIFRLSAGILRDMIRLTGLACWHANKRKSKIVEEDDVEPVWNETIQFYHDILYKSDYEILKEVRKNPRPPGLDAIPNLIFRKAIVCYPNGWGWYKVHSAVLRLMDQLKI
jgi:hypothetical protein